jgi:hypothetical protein
MDDAGVLAVVRERSRPPSSLYAELSMSFEGPDGGGVFDTVVLYEAPERLRLSAFRALLVSTRVIFDLVLDGGRSELLLAAGEPGEEPRRFAGPAEDLGSVHPGFRMFAVLREGLFLPGSMPCGAAGGSDEGEHGGLRLERARGLELRGALDGAEVVWTLHPPTLGILAARLHFVGEAEPIEIDFLGYREHGGRYFPERFRMRDPGARVRIEGLLRELALDVELESGDFLLERGAAREEG